MSWMTYRKSRRSSWSRRSRWSILPPFSPLTLKKDGTLRWRRSAGAEGGGNWTCKRSSKTLPQSNKEGCGDCRVKTLQSPHVNLTVRSAGYMTSWVVLKSRMDLSPPTSALSDGEHPHNTYADDVLLCLAPLGLPAGPSVLESPGCPRCHGSPGFPERPEAPAHRVHPAATWGCKEKSARQRWS